MNQRITNRVNKIYLNGTIAILSHLIQVIMGFVVRRMFITSLGTEFLGYDAVFTNILQILNLADLGIGVAVTSFLYKPLAEEDNHRIFALMLLFRRAYRIIGIIVFFVGICILGFLDEIIPDAGISIWDLRLLFLINLISCSATYFLAYKRILLNADQKTYITDACDTAVFIIVSLAQMTVLSTVPNYFYFLLLNAIKNIVSNIIINIKSDYFYGNINKHVKVEDIIYYRPLLGKYIKDIFISRVGAMVYYATDHVIISAIKGSLLAGLLSNYTLITNVLLSSVNQLLFSVQSTFGNYINVNQNMEEQKKMTDCYFCVHFIIGCFVMNCFALMVQPFVGLVFGKQLLLSSSTVLWLSINLLLSVLLQLPSQVFIIYKLFRHDRLIIIISTILNISISVWLVKLIGIDGALIGTFVTSLIYLFSRFNIIARHVYHVEFSNYLKKTFFYFMVAGISLVVSFMITKPILRNDYLSLFIWSVLIILCAAFFPVTILCKTKDFQFIVGKMLPDKLQKLLKPVNLWIMSIALIVLSLSIGFFRPGYALPLGGKSGIRLDSYVVEKDMQDKYFHLSIDDTSQCFKYISEHDAVSIFEEPTFAWLKKKHDKYGVVVSCYVFYEDGEFSLSNMSEKYKEENKNVCGRVL